MILAFGFALLQAAAPPIRVTVNPAKVYIERSRFDQQVQFDFLIENQSDDSVRLKAVRLTATDPTGKPWSIRFVDESGIDPGIETIPRRTIPPRSALLVYNPFHTLPLDAPIGPLRYELAFAHGSDEWRVGVRVDPVRYRQPVELILPLAGRTLVFAGHDFYSHHRRVNYEHPLLKQAGFKSNPERYAHDFSLVDSAGKMFRGTGSRNEDWLSWGVPIVAPAAGRVVAVENGMPDYDVGKGGGLPLDSIMTRPASLMGNYVIVDHGGGMFSRMFHMMRGSVRVRVGQPVTQGQEMGRVGFSGSVYTVHLHYEVGSAPNPESEGLPAYFSRSIAGTSSSGRAQEAAISSGFRIPAGDYKNYK